MNRAPLWATSRTSNSWISCLFEEFNHLSAKIFIVCLQGITNALTNLLYGSVSSPPLAAEAAAANYFQLKSSNEPSAPNGRQSWRLSSCFSGVGGNKPKSVATIEVAFIKT